MRIGELSTATGVSTRSLRYYEQQGLIRSQRSSNGYRDYRPETVEAVAFVQDLFAAGLSSRLLREIMPCVAEGGLQQTPADLRDRVESVRADLLEQEQRLRSRRHMLDDYLAGRATPGHAPTT
jgi:DNA-binding transcriptional MerR regulator